MTKRGAKSPVTIAGHNLTWAELAVLNQLKKIISAVRPTGKVSLRRIFSDRKRHCARHLAEVGVLAAEGIEIVDDYLVLPKGQTP